MIVNKTKTYLNIWGKNESLMIDVDKYTSTDRIALSVDYWDGEYECWDAWGTMTVNIPEASLQPDEVILKIWSENDPWVLDLVKQLGFLTPVDGKYVSTGYVLAPVFKLAEGWQWWESKGGDASMK